MTPRILLLGGLDPSGGAGLTVDATVVERHGARPLPVALVLTEQNRFGFRRAHAVPAAQWGGALECALGDGDVHAIKVGLCADADQMALLARHLSALRPRVPLVVDPVLSATAGGFVATSAHVAACLEHLVPLATVVTPNLPELEALANGDAARVLARGAAAVLVKGGHGEGAFVDEELWRRDGVSRWRRPRLPVGRVRGTGCALAAALAVGLARGLDVVEAAERAGDWLARCLGALSPATDRLPRWLPLRDAAEP